MGYLDLQSCSFIHPYFVHFIYYCPKKMWWEILPSLTIVVVGMWLPQAIYGPANMLHKNGKAYARYWQDGLGLNPDWQMYLRDLRITGSVYIPRGLESLPEEKSK